VASLIISDCKFTAESAGERTFKGEVIGKSSFLAFWLTGYFNCSRNK